LSLAELNSYRKLFDDKRYFFIIDASRNNYFNNAANEFAGRELRYRLNPSDPTLAWDFATKRNVDTFDLHVDNNPQRGVTKISTNAIVRGEDRRKLGLGGSGLDLSAFLKNIVRSTDMGVETWFVASASTKGALAGSPPTGSRARVRCRSFDSLSALGHADPCMPPRFIDRYARRRKLRIGEGAERNRDEIGRIVDRVVDRRAAGGAEAEAQRVATVGDTLVFARIAVDVHLIARKARLRGEHATGTTLAGEAVTHRDTHGFAARADAQCAATAAGMTLGHGTFRRERQEPRRYTRHRI